jgi:hypothetical protein
MRLLVAFELLAPVLFAQVPEPKFIRPAPEQPLPFSHKKHAGELKLACLDCHPIPGNGDFATLPQTSTCMNCHRSVAAQSPHITRLAAAHQAGAKIRWAPVYRIPDYVFFNHRKHVSVPDVTCATCHGPVAVREQLRREKDISMAACMDCHRAKQVSNDCLLCHEQR